MSDETKKQNFGSQSTGVRFDRINSEIIQLHCISCHNNHSQGVNFRSYEEVMMYVLPSRPEFSIIWEKVDQDLMPKDGALSADKKQLLLDWINQGAMK